jgi:hypothetical protein
LLARPASAQTRVTSSRRSGLFADFFNETTFIVNLQLILGDHKKPVRSADTDKGDAAGANIS